ncbi:hypothetical protein FSARC_7335 [Fusarium sarcochroum]|uniref:Small secreted protein n=1 Tax=Fusarium sarcochroum TaxID=1208366 RepID=A0A8H4TVC7_9HYPO|nr:hypothetical protein FSARC_7335 [Fusarium sarcochroum]
MKLSTVVASAVALAVGASASASTVAPEKPIVVGTVNSDKHCSSKSQLKKWTITNGRDRCVMFDQELGVEDYSIKSLRIDAINDPNCRTIMVVTWKAWKLRLVIAMRLIAGGGVPMLSSVLNEPSSQD